ncbi:MAG: DNA adenine methylase [Saprospiraceae bacterium]|nr:DNA adenine methylase [Saprospiraceae bacterium]
MNKFIPRSVVTAVDAFAGSQTVAFLLKQLGFQVITNDFLSFNHQIGLALIENGEQKLTQADLNFLLSISPKKEQFRLIEQVYTDVFFEKEEAEFLDNFRANLEFFENPYKKALAFAIINRSMTRKVTMGHFGHTQALRYANDPARIRRNRSLVRPLKEIFLELVPAYNSAVFSNKKNNRSFNQNILDLLPTMEKVDLIYFDPPYCDSHPDYQSFYHLLETYTEYWQDKQFINGIKRYEPQRFSGFDKKKDVARSFEKLFEQAQEIPHWLISYNDRSYPSVEELTNMISKYRNVEIEAKTYQNGRGGKGSIAGSREILFVCKPKPKHFVNLTSRAEIILNEEL